MYNDEHNLYHYTYRKDGSETETHPAPQAGPAPEYQNGPQQPVQEMKPVKKNRVGMKLTALALCCALLGGAVGGGIVWGVSNSGEEDSTTINVSDRTVSQVAVNTVDGTDRDERRGGLRRQRQQRGVHQRHRHQRLPTASASRCRRRPPAPALS